MNQSLLGQAHPIDVTVSQWDKSGITFCVTDSSVVWRPDDVVCLMSTTHPEKPCWLGQVEFVDWANTSELNVADVTAQTLWGTWPDVSVPKASVYRWVSADCERYLAILASDDRFGPLVQVGHHPIGFASVLAQSTTVVYGDSVGGKHAVVAALAQQLSEQGVWVIDPSGRYQIPNEVPHRLSGERGISLKDVGWATLANYLGYQFPPELRRSLWDWFGQMMPELMTRPFLTLDDFIEQARQQEAMPLIEADLNRLAALRIFATSANNVLPIYSAEQNAGHVHRLDLSATAQPWQGLVLNWMANIWCQQGKNQPKKPVLVFVQPEAMGDAWGEQLARLQQVGYGLVVVPSDAHVDTVLEQLTVGNVCEATHHWLLESLDEDIIFKQPDGQAQGGKRPYDVSFQFQGSATRRLPMSWTLPGDQLAIHAVESRGWVPMPQKLPVLDASQPTMMPPAQPTLAPSPQPVMSGIVSVRHEPVLESPLETAVSSHRKLSSSEAVLTEALYDVPDESDESDDLGNSFDFELPEIPESTDKKEGAENDPVPNIEAVPESESEPESDSELIVLPGVLQDALDDIEGDDIEGDEPVVPSRPTRREAQPNGASLEQPAQVAQTLTSQQNSQQTNVRDIRTAPTPSPAVRNADSQAPYDVGDRVRHPRYGEGTVDRIIPTGGRLTVRVMFDDAGKRLLDAERSALEVLR